MPANRTQDACAPMRALLWCAPVVRSCGALLHWLATKLSEQRLQFLDHHFMRGAVGGHDPVTIVDSNSVVTQRLSKQISRASARLSQNYFRRTSVPLLGARRKMQIEVGFLLCNQTNLHTYGSASQFIFKTKGFNDPLHTRAAVRAA